MKTTFLRFAALAIWAILTLAPHTANAAHQVFLVQNSGWMEPFYTDPKSQFKPLIEALIATVTTPGEVVTVAAFNQQTPDNPSPKMVFSGAFEQASVGSAIRGIDLATKGPGKTLADTDFREAIEATIGALQRQPGILWIVTNNKNSPKNDPDTAKRNREFYHLLHHAAPILRTIAFPLGMPVQGKNYSASGLMIYALAYGEEADAHLMSLIDSGLIRRVLQNAPLRLKPLDSDSIQFSAESVKKTAGGSSVNVSFRGNRMLIDIDADDSKQPTILVTARMSNIFNPYRIDHAKVSANFAGAWKGDLAVTPSEIRNLLPGSGQEVEIKVPLPFESVPSLWSPALIKEFGRSYLLHNQIEMVLDEQKLSIPDSFREELRQIFPGDPMPDVFLPPENIRRSTLTMPVDIRIHYPSYPIFIIGGLFVLLLGAVAGLASMRSGQKQFRVMVDGREIVVSVKKFSSTDVINNNGVVVGHVRRGWDKAEVASTTEGHNLSILT